MAGIEYVWKKKIRIKMTKKKSPILNIMIVLVAIILALVIIIPTIQGSSLIDGVSKKRVTCGGTVDWDVNILGFFGKADIVTNDCQVQNQCGILFNQVPLQSITGFLSGKIAGTENLNVVLKGASFSDTHTLKNVNAIDGATYKVNICVPQTTTTATVQLFREDGTLADTVNVAI